MIKLKLGLVLFASLIIGSYSTLKVSSISTFAYVAHAGGSCDGYLCTNSLEALISSVQDGYRLIEIDITKTTDNFFVLNHDWSGISSRVAFAQDIRVTNKEFLNYKLYNRFTTMNLEMLINFLDRYEDVRIITDTKGRDYSALFYISENYKEYLSHFIPQVYSFASFDSIKQLGYSDIIIALYDMPLSLRSDADEVCKQAKRLNPYALSIPDELISKEYAKVLGSYNINYFVHTVNDRERIEELKELGAYGVYSDTALNANSLSSYQRKITELEFLLEYIDEDASSLAGCLIYKEGSEICIKDGKVELIYRDLITPLKQTKGSTFYLPFKKTLEYFGGTEYTFLPFEKAVSMEYNGNVYKVSTNQILKNNEILALKEKNIILHNLFLVPDNFFKDTIDCEIMKLGKYLILYSTKAHNLETMSKILLKIGARW